MTTASTNRRWRVAGVLGHEVTGGVLLLIATVAALVLANTVTDAYLEARDTYLGADFGVLSLRMSVGHWVADGLLAVFFFLAGLELKKEIAAGDLSDARRAMVPVAAAIGGVVVPAVLYLAVLSSTGAPGAQGWAIPVATDIAFALAVLAVVGRRLPAAVRTFLLALAVVDDLIAITIIAVFYTHQLAIGFLAAAVIPLAGYAWLVRRHRSLFLTHPWAAWALLLPVALVTWALVYNSGVHATLAGVALAFTVPVRGSDGTVGTGLADALEHRIKPLSAGVCVPLFAFFSAGIVVGGWSGLTSALGQGVAIGIMVGLVAGKVLGIVGATWLVTRLPGARLDSRLGWAELTGLALLAGIGFTVSLLIAELTFAGTPLENSAKIGVLVASTLAALIGGGLLWQRGRRRPAEAQPQPEPTTHQTRGRQLAGVGPGHPSTRGVNRFKNRPAGRPALVYAGPTSLS